MQKYILQGENGERFEFVGTEEDLNNFVLSYEKGNEPFFVARLVKEKYSVFDGQDIQEFSFGDKIFENEHDAQKYADIYNNYGEEEANRFLESL